MLFIRSARSYIATDARKLWSRGQLTRAVHCQVSDIRRVSLSNEGVTFGVTRPWSLTVDLPFGEQKVLNSDVRRFAWLDAFRLADFLHRRCEGPAMPYLAFVACGYRHLTNLRGTLTREGAWALVQKLRDEGATGKLILQGPSGERWIYLIKGRNLRLEEGWPREVKPDDLGISSRAYEFQRSALSEEEISMVLRVLEDKWLGTNRGIRPPAS